VDLLTSKFADKLKEICGFIFLSNLRLHIEPKNLKKQLKFCHHCQRYRWPTANSINDASYKFATSASKGAP
jgi:hypothetical protein